MLDEIVSGVRSLYYRIPSFFLLLDGLEQRQNELELLREGGTLCEQALTPDLAALTRLHRHFKTKDACERWLKLKLVNGRCGHRSFACGSSAVGGGQRLL